MNGRPIAPFLNLVEARRDNWDRSAARSRSSPADADGARFLRSRDRIRRVERQRLFAEHMLARLQRGDDLRRMQRSRRDEPDGVDRRVGEQGLVVVVKREFGQVARAPTRALPRPGCTPPTSAAPRHAHARFSRMARGPSRPKPTMPIRSRRAFMRRLPELRRSALRATTRVAASASSSAFRPSATVVRTGLPSVGVEEMRDLERIRRAIALEEEMLGHIAAIRPSSATRDFGRAHVARLQHAVAAEHFEALVVAVRRAPRSC